jgi:hypothetical protein
MGDDGSSPEQGQDASVMHMPTMGTDAGMEADVEPTATPDAQNDAPSAADASSSDANMMTEAAATPSPYAEACKSSMTCTAAGVTCQKFSFGGGAINGYACSQSCQSAGDCATSPSGTAPSDCLMFTTQKFCVLTCDASSTDPSVCPSPLKCAADQGAPTGICVNL